MSKNLNKDEMKERIEEISFKAMEKRNEFIENILKEKIKQEFGLSITTIEDANNFFKKNPDVVLEILPLSKEINGNFTERLIFRKGSKIYSCIEVSLIFGE